jgi:hypothetical protein
MTQYGAGFWFVTQAHSPAHIGICAGECNAGDGPKDKQEVQLFLAETLIPELEMALSAPGTSLLSTAFSTPPPRGTWFLS